jgi:hypothetical protein
MEIQDSAMTNYNDLPVRNYDFQAPLGDFGQIRPQYHLLRRLHLFLADFGPEFAHMPASMPDIRPGPRDDASTLRWAVRSDGKSGYVFINNYERSREMPAKRSEQFAVVLAAGTVTFPAAPVDIPADSLFFWPFDLDLGHGVRLAYATAEPICFVDDPGGRTIFFAETRGVGAQFSIAGEASARTVSPSRAAAFEISGSDGKAVRVVLLGEADSLALWKGRFQGRDRVFLTRAGLVLDGDVARLSSGDRSELTLGIYPAPTGLPGGESDGIFTRYTPEPPLAVSLSPEITEVQKAGPAREIPIGRSRSRSRLNRATLTSQAPQSGR